MNFESWLLFFSIAIVTSIVPGPAVLLATMHGFANGLKGAIFAILGNVSGLLVMSALSVFGLSAIFILSTPVFIVVKTVGAAYLIFLGLKLWVKGINTEKVFIMNKENQAKGFGKLYLQGVFVALSNPKAIVFTSALFPQFINQSDPIAIQFTILVFTFMSASFICLSLYAYLATRTKHGVKWSAYSSLFSKLFGSAFVASGIFLANASRKQA